MSSVIALLGSLVAISPRVGGARDHEESSNSTVRQQLGHCPQSIQG